MFSFTLLCEEERGISPIMRSFGVSTTPRGESRSRVVSWAKHLSKIRADPCNTFDYLGPNAPKRGLTLRFFPQAIAGPLSLPLDLCIGTLGDSARRSTPTAETRLTETNKR